MQTRKKKPSHSVNPKTPAVPKKRKTSTPIAATRRRGRPRGSKKRERVQIANLVPFRDIATQTEASFFATCDASTNTKHDRFNQPAGRLTAADNMVHKCHRAYDKLQCCQNPGFHWTSHMVYILLQFCFYQIFWNHHNFTTACLVTSTMFKINQNNVSKLVRLYLHKIEQPTTTNFCPDELPQKKRGWGAASFTHKKDDYCVMKEVHLHLKVVQEYVTQRNKYERYVHR